MEDVGATPTDFFDHDPSKQEKIEVSLIDVESKVDGTLLLAALSMLNVPLLVPLVDIPRCCVEFVSCCTKPTGFLRVFAT